MKGMTDPFMVSMAVLLEKYVVSKSRLVGALSTVMVRSVLTWNVVL